MKNKCVCCFCDKKVDREYSIQIQILISKKNVKYQTIYSHKKCLKKAVHKKVLLHPDLTKKTN